MNEPKLRPARRKTQRRWRIPPVLTQGPEVFEGLGVLDEVRGDTGVLLWQALRDASLWAESDPELRTRLFHPRARAAEDAHPSIPPELAGPVRELEGLRADPGSRRPSAVAAACGTVSGWAEGLGYLSTALAFSQACALAEPMDAAAACDVARLARRRAEEARAETWYRRTVAVARQQGDWVTYSRAFLGLGALHARRGSLSAARRFHMRAFRAANRNTLRELEARALHRLFLIAAGVGQRADAVRLARESLALYGAAHPRTARLAFDAARHWGDGGQFARALPVLRALFPRLEGPTRISGLAELARAAAGAGDPDAFLDAWTQAWELVRESPGKDPSARAVLSLARGAALLGAWGKAESAARHALRIATAAGEERGIAAAERVLEAVSHRALPGPAPRPEAAGTAAAAGELAAELTRALGG